MGRQLTVDNPVTVVAPKNAPPRLRRLASREGVAPMEYLRQVLSRHVTQEAAADEMQVTSRTVTEWKKWARFVVVRQ